MKHLEKYNLIRSSFLINEPHSVKSAESKMTKEEKITELLSMLVGGAGGFVLGDQLGDTIDAKRINPFYGISGGFLGMPLITALAGSYVARELHKSQRRKREKERQDES